MTAAGNDATDEGRLPADHAGPVVANASGLPGRRRPFTTFGDPSALAAPRADVVPTAP